MSNTAVHPIDLILRKREGGELSRAEIQAWVQAVADFGTIPTLTQKNPATQTLPVAAGITEAQIAALLMAIYQRGLSLRELDDLTQAMRFSGEVFEHRGLDAFTVDKHSTGGVGDKTSLLIAPIVAAAGVGGAHRIAVPMISGRSLGHTGGTLDKLETIPGFDTQLSLPRMREVLERCGAVMVGQTPRLVPADRVLYALRDHTGTVESPFLITASIMSKKLAEDLRGLVLDVKVGSGAFLPAEEASRQLAELMVATGERAGTRTVALLTSMEEPLGRFAGNWLEVWECVDVLRGRGHPQSAEMVELSCILAGWMLFLAGAVGDAGQGAARAEELLANGEAYRSWRCMVQAQGGDLRVFDDPAAVHQPAARQVLRAPRAGYLAGMDCREVGWAVQRLGAGRYRPGEPVSAHAGLEIHAKIGAWLEAGAPVFTLFSDDAALLEEPYRMLESTLRFSSVPPQRAPLVREVIGGATGG